MNRIDRHDFFWHDFLLKKWKFVGNENWISLLEKLDHVRDKYGRLDIQPSLETVIHLTNLLLEVARKNIAINKIHCKNINHTGKKQMITPIDFSLRVKDLSGCFLYRNSYDSHANSPESSLWDSMSRFLVDPSVHGEKQSWPFDPKTWISFLFLFMFHYLFLIAN